MGQKVNPTSLRLHPENKHFDSCWFSEKQYGHSIHKNLNVEIYSNAILKQIQYPEASFFFEGAPRKSRVSVLFLNPTQLREQAFRQFQSSSRGNKRGGQNTLFSAKKETPALSLFCVKKEDSFLTSLPPYFFPPLFLQKLKNQGSRQNVKKNQNLVQSSFLQVKRAELGNAHATNQKRDRQQVDPAGHFVPARNRSLPDKSLNVSPFARGRRDTFESKSRVCSSLLGLAISQYFVQKKGGENLLSATSRFLLLQAFFSFLKINRKPAFWKEKEGIRGDLQSKATQRKHQLVSQ